MLSGRIFEHPRSERPTTEIDSGSLLPTPTASSYGSNRGGSAGRSGQRSRPNLDAYLPTPQARDQKLRKWADSCIRSAGKSESVDAFLPTPTVSGDFNVQSGSQRSGDGPSTVAGLSIRLREWMMGFPAGWVRRARRSATA